MNEQRMQFAIGVVTLIAGFALASIIIWFGEFQFVLQARKQYYVLFESAPGAEAKVPVRRAGIRIGEVIDVHYADEESLVVMTIVIEGDNDLREGDEPVLKRSLLGDTYLEIETRPEMRGKRNRPIIPPQRTLEGRSPLDPTETIEQASTVVPNANRTLDELARAAQQWNDVGRRTNRLLEVNEQRLTMMLEDSHESIRRLATTLDSINQALDAKAQENFRVTLENLRKGSEELTPVLESSRKAIEQITNTTAQLDEVTVNLKAATKPLAQRSEKTMENLERSSEALSLVLEDVHVLTKRLRSQDGTLQRLMNDPSLYQNLDDASHQLVQILRELEKVMEDVRVFSDKIARHPGELGVQGVFTKDQGTKSLPRSVLEGRR